MLTTLLTSEGIQSMLDALFSYNIEWKLSLNVIKTKIVVFRNGGLLREMTNGFIMVMKLKL